MTENHSKILKIYTPFDNFQTEVIGPTGEELIQQLYLRKLQKTEI
jgi:hypothetical protein